MRYLCVTPSFFQTVSAMPQLCCLNNRPLERCGQAGFGLIYCERFYLLITAKERECERLPASDGIWLGLPGLVPSNAAGTQVKDTAGQPASSSPIA